MKVPHLVGCESRPLIPLFWLEWRIGLALSLAVLFRGTPQEVSAQCAEGLARWTPQSVASALPSPQITLLNSPFAKRTRRYRGNIRYFWTSTEAPRLVLVPTADHWHLLYIARLLKELTTERTDLFISPSPFMKVFAGKRLQKLYSVAAQCN
jgi:hypothetical protein